MPHRASQPGEHTCNGMADAIASLEALLSARSGSRGGEGKKHAHPNAAAIASRTAEGTVRAQRLIADLNTVAILLPRAPHPTASLLAAATALRDFFHNDVCSDMFVGCALKRLDGFAARLAAARRRVALLRPHFAPAGSSVGCGCGGSDVAGGPVPVHTPSTAIRHARVKGALVSALSSERSFSALSSQAPRARVDAFIPQRLLPIRDAGIASPAGEAVRSGAASARQQQSWLSGLSRALHEERAGLDAARGTTQQIESFVAMAAANSGSTQQPRSDASWSDVSVSIVVNKLDAEIVCQQSLSTKGKFRASFS